MFDRHNLSTSTRHQQLSFPPFSRGLPAIYDKFAKFLRIRICATEHTLNVWLCPSQNKDHPLCTNKKTVSFEIKLPLFEGPFDLLLFFIERDELDIHDIPISRITGDFLGYMHELEQLNIEVASEFILVAATLMRIKAKMLLPRPVINEVGEEVDPRDELVRHLLEYKKYKSIIEDLATLEEQRLLRHERGNAPSELKQLSEVTNVEAELQDLTLYKLLKVLERVTERYEQKQQEKPHQVVQYPYTIAGQRTYIAHRLRGAAEPVAFSKIIAEDRSKIAIIFNFLAVLELLQLGEIAIRIGEGFNNFWISLAESPVVDGD